MHHTNRLIAFIFGDVFAMIVAWAHIGAGSDFFTTLLMTIVFGFIGGASGMSGKEFILWTIKTIKSYVEKD